MKVRTLFLACAAAVALALSGCATQPAPAPSSAAPAVHHDTEKQVASVLAKYATDWKATIGKAAECRFDYLTEPSSIDSLQCSLNEQLIEAQSKLVTDQWGELNEPDSMTRIVDDTTLLLNEIQSADFAGNCAPKTTYVASAACSSTTTTLLGIYVSLGEELDAWSPYLG